LALVLLLSVPVVAFGQEVNTLTEGPDYTKDQIAEYKDAITNCETPSLECLVHYTSRYIAIEWLMETVGSAGEETARPIPPIDPDLINDGSQVLPNQSRLAREGGVIGALNQTIAEMYAHKPADTATFVADAINSSRLAPPAYAQGLGFAALNPVLDLWKVFRNIAYTFFVLIFIVIGFMIMFRTKISGNAAVTAQQAIPSIIMSLIFVTFSYAIAGFMIDLMYLSMYLILGIFGTALRDSSGMEIINYNIVNLAGKMFTSSGFSADAFDRNGNIIEVFLDSFTDNPLLNNGAVEFIGNLLFSLIMAIAALIATVKLFFELLKSYASIIVSVVMAPVMLMLGAIPGRNTFTPWLRNIAGNLIAFPTVLLVLAIFYQFVGDTGQQRFEEGGFMPPFLLGRGQADIVASLVGFALLLALPEIVKKAKEAVGAKGGIGEMVAGAAWGRAKEAWSGKMPLGLNARNIAKVGAGATTALATTPIGALAGGMISKARGGTFGSGARKGALVGAATPFVAPMIPSLAKEGMGIISSEAKQLVAEETVNAGLHYLSQRQGKIGAAAANKLAQRQLDQSKKQPQTTKDTTTGGDHGKGY
jgi:hypothetical protein